jgi:hypothetical protein
MVWQLGVINHVVVNMDTGWNIFAKNRAAMHPAILGAPPAKHFNPHCH